jgi:hypothetical protein
MGLLLPESRFLSWSTSLRLAKSDWLYEQLIELGIIRKLLDRLLLNDSPIRNTFEQTTNHDQRAALVCLLTAMFAVDGTATIIGDKQGGWFWLPPIGLWAGWAQDSLTLALSKHQSGAFPNTARWTAAATEICQ